MRYLYTTLFSLLSLAAFAQFDFGDAMAKYENDAQLQKLYLDLGPLLIIQDDMTYKYFLVNVQPVPILVDQVMMVISEVLLLTVS